MWQEESEVREGGQRARAKPRTFPCARKQGHLRGLARCTGQQSEEHPQVCTCDSVHS